MKPLLLMSIAQGAAIAVDEFVFHHKRGLPKWERLSHPFDTSMVIICLLFLYFFERTPSNQVIYFVLAGISCIGVTKDEWIHHKHCKGTEMWLHGILFAMHPLVLFTAYQAWETSGTLILAVAICVMGFLTYEITYWNFLRDRWEKPTLPTRAKPSEADLYEYFGE